jgi:hypothetical protein
MSVAQFPDSTEDLYCGGNEDKRSKKNSVAKLAALAAGRSL